jgi:hypothetical protein
MKSLLLATGMLIVSISMAQSEDAYVCKLFAREYLRIVYAHNLRTFGKGDQQKDPADTTADTTKLPFYYKKLIATCLGSAKTPDLPDFPEAADNAWLEDLVNNHMSKALGPPTETKPTQSVAEKATSVIEQSRATDTCNKVNMRVSWTNNGRSWRCVK